MYVLLGQKGGTEDSLGADICLWEGQIEDPLTYSSFADTDLYCVKITRSEDLHLRIGLKYSYTFDGQSINDGFVESFINMSRNTVIFYQIYDI